MIADTATKVYVCSGSVFEEFIERREPHNHIIKRFLEHMACIDAASPTEAASVFLEIAGFRPEYIDTKEVVEYCESCDRPLFDGEDYHLDADGDVAVCLECCSEGE